MAGGAGLLPAARLHGAAEPAVSQQRRRHVHRRDGGGRHGRASSARRSASSTADFNGDGWIDIYVANDGQPNQLWINQRNGTFRNTALLAGAALGADGEAKSSMGVDAGDFDNDGDEDLFITELTGQGVDLYVNDGSGVFEEQSARTGLRLASLPSTGFGTAWLDVDNDGWLDLLTVNGAVTQKAGAPARAHDAFSLQQRKQLFRNTGQRRFEDVTGRAGAIFQQADVGRGAAFGDVDNDGDLDVVVGNASGPLRLLVNGIGQQKHWIGLRLTGRAGAPRHGRGARRDRPVRWRDALASRESRWQLRLGERSAGARGPRRSDGAANGPRPMAGRPRRGMARGRDRSLHDAAARHRNGCGRAMQPAEPAVERHEASMPHKRESCLLKKLLLRVVRAVFRGRCSCRRSVCLET